ncbi:MAG TPA: hypothetical protein VIF15_15445 [Polyangiaceae bacterium]
MRLGLLGPANGDLAGLARTAEFLLNGARVTRAIYLGGDDALEETVGLWAESLVGHPDPSDEGIWDRAFTVAATGSVAELDTFLRGERGRMRLKSLERLPPDELRSVEMFGDRVAVLLHDKALLDEEDIFSASLLIYGRSDAPLIKKIGPRWFLTPGPIGGPGCGAIVLDDAGDDLVATLYDAEGRVSHSEALHIGRAAKLSVQG